MNRFARLCCILPRQGPCLSDFSKFEAMLEAGVPTSSAACRNYIYNPDTICLGLPGRTAEWHGQGLWFGGSGLIGSPSWQSQTGRVWVILPPHSTCAPIPSRSAMGSWGALSFLLLGSSIGGSSSSSSRSSSRSSSGLESGPLQVLMFLALQLRPHSNSPPSKSFA